MGWPCYAHGWTALPAPNFECSVPSENGNTIGVAWTTGIRHCYKNLWVATGFVVRQEHMTGNNWTDVSWKRMWDALMERAQDREAWRNAVLNLSILPEVVPDPTSLRRNPMRAVRSLHSTVAGATPNTF